MSEHLAIWTISNSPADCPGQYVARKFLIDANAEEPVVTPEVIVSGSLESIRDKMQRMHLSCITRDERDEPHIVESWL
jgi:hypothetical protein